MHNVLYMCIYIPTCLPVALATSIRLTINCKPFVLADRAFRRVQSAITAFNSSSGRAPSLAFLCVLPSCCTSLYNSGQSDWSSEMTALIENYQNALQCPAHAPVNTQWYLSTQRLCQKSSALRTSDLLSTSFSKAALLIVSLHLEL